MFKTFNKIIFSKITVPIVYTHTHTHTHTHARAQQKLIISISYIDAISLVFII